MSVLATGIGSMPGDDTSGEGYREAVRTSCWASSPDLAYVPEMPGRGPAAAMTGRTLAVVEGLDADLQPAGWRLTGGSGQPRASTTAAPAACSPRTSTRSRSSDRATPGSSSCRSPARGRWPPPWRSRAAHLVLGDHGARRDLAEALAEGVRAHVRDVRRRMPAAASLVVQLDEPALPSVLGGGGADRLGLRPAPHRAPARGLRAARAGRRRAIVAEDAEPWVHSCAAGTPLSLLRGAGARGLLVDVDRLTAADHDVLAEALEAGETVVLGVVPAHRPRRPESAVSDTALTQRVARWLDMLGLDPTSAAWASHPTCGLAGASPAWSRRALALSRTVADNLTNLG